MKQDLVAITDGIKHCGAVVFWRLDGTMDAGLLTKAWTASQLPLEWLPNATTPAVALRLAMDSAKDSAEVLRHHDGGQAIFTRTFADGAKDPTYTLYIHAAVISTVNADGSEEPKLVFRGTAVDENNQIIVKQIQAAFDNAMRVINSLTCSHWLSILMDKMHGVALRDKGGVYYIPPQYVETQRKVFEAIELSSQHTLSEMPAMQSKQAAQAILAAITQEANAFAEDLIEKAAGNKLGKRAIAARVNESEVYLSKLAEYEAIIGGKLDALRIKMSNVQAALCAATLAASSDE